MEMIYHLFLVCLLLSLCAYNNADHVMKSNSSCLEVEREALLAFKQGVTEGMLSSWKGEDCCRWENVECNNHSDARGQHHVVRLALPEFHLKGEISPQCGNLSRLEYLDLSGNSELKVTDLRWLESLTSLVTLDLSGIELDQAGEGLFQSINKLPSLVVLYLSRCGLSKLPESLPHINLTTLAVLGLSSNNFNSSVPPWIFNLTGLERLDLRENHFGGVITDWDFSNFKVLGTLFLGSIGVGGQLPRSLGSLCKLENLDLSYNRLTRLSFQGFSNCSNGNNLMYLNLKGNQLEGEIPTSIGILKHLKELSLEYNYLSGPIPQSSIGQLKELTILDLGEQHYEGFITELMFLSLKSLSSFSIGSNKVIFNITLDWMPPFKLYDLSIINCHVGPKFPKWILVQSTITSIILRNVSISDTLPANWSSSQLHQMDLADNHITGRIPSWIYSLDILQLNNNHLSGPLPECFNQSNFLRFLDLSNNDIFGMLPSSMFLSTGLKVLSLSDNSLQGRLPASLQNSSLGSLDVGGNILSGTLPTYTPASWVLRLRSNSFHGPIPEQWCSNPELHFLDLADNNLSGPIPKCISNLTKLWLNTEEYTNNDGPHIIYSLEFAFREQINAMTKGAERKYTTTAPLLNIIDLSRNNLSDKIPVELMNLTGLSTLNLSMNHLVGKIPKNIGNMRSLETLDLSNNNLSGDIPQSISSIDFLSHLNLSFNQLEGRIPSGRQLQTLNDDLSIYEGNPLLCGLPLPNKCHADGGDSPGGKFGNGEETKDDDENLLWFFLFMGAGFTFGTCGVFFVLWISVSFRKTLFEFFRLY